MSRRKNKHPVIENLMLTAYAAEGKSIGYLPDGRVLFAEGGVPGDVVSIRLGRSKKNYAEGKVIQVETPWTGRTEPFCPHFGICGGCKWQMLPYQAQLQFKQQQVGDQLKRISGIPDLPEVMPILGSPRERYYRNKLEFTFSAQRYRTTGELKEADGADLPDEPAFGFHAPGLFDKVVPIHTCFLQDEPTDTLLRVLRDYTEKTGTDYYHFREQRGWLRNAIIRVTKAGEVLINIVFRDERETDRVALLDHLLRNVPGITTLHYANNGKANDSLYDIPVHTYQGPGYIEETLGGFRFRISPKSFFQTNPYGAGQLYEVARDFAGLTGTETLYDLYCGTGSIGIFCSAGAGKVIGVETVADAVKDAEINAGLNGLTNCRFFAGDVSDVCTDAFFETHGRPDVVMTDPPRAGMHAGLIEQLLRMRAPRIVYVSCNPATQARDLGLLAAAYRVEKLQPVDMFPHTHHVENVALLTLMNEE